VRLREPDSESGHGYDTPRYRVELRGLEPLNENVLSCGNADFADAKRREPTPNDLRVQRKVLTASIRHMVCRSKPKTCTAADLPFTAYDPRSVSPGG
jgi:hypothetical protein